VARKKRSYRYRKNNSASRIKRKIKLFGFAVLSVVISVFILLGISVYKFINAPFTSASNVYQNDSNVWKPDNTNVLLILLDDRNDKYSEIKKLGLINFDIPTKRYTIYWVPVDTEIDYALNYGKGTFSRILAVGNTDQDRGIFLLNKTILKTLAIKVDGYIAVDQDGLNKITDVSGKINQEDLSSSLRLRNLPNLPKLVSTFRNNANTNLHLSDIKSIIGFIRNTSETSSSIESLTKYHLIDSENWDSLWQSKLDMSGVKKEAVKVFVANASKDPKIPGLATWGARVVKNIGASVLETQNAFVDFDEDTIITDNTDLETVKKLAQSLGIKNIINVDDLNQNGGYNLQIFRTSVTLVITKF